MPQQIHQKVSTLSRSRKKAIMIAADIVMIPLALWAAWALRMGEVWPIPRMEPFWWMYPAVIPVGILIFAKLGLYRAVVRFMGSQAVVAVAKGAAIMALLLWSLAYTLKLQSFPRSVPINFALVLLVFIGGSRVLVRGYYQWLIKHFTEKEAVLIYGAGGAGTQLASALMPGNEFYPVAFIDDDKALWKHTVQGIRVHPPKDIQKKIDEHSIKKVLLALPNASKSQRKAVLDRLTPYPVHVQTIPSMSEILAGSARVDQLQEVELEDLLGRDPVPPKEELFTACIQGKTVLVTGAGGSIGSELCRQIIKAEPSQLILYEISEFALYAVEQELSKAILASGGTICLVPVLGSVCNRQRLQELFQRYSVHTVYHAAAYKHVPIVEHNVFEGIRNNVVGTYTVAELAKQFTVERFVLISTDKAVRPTNVMGATKRFAELLVQDLAVECATTVFSMVRFGNVLGSSGSVVPLFREQIQAGGPLTVTHPDITRFFMTIPEASQLVIQAGAMAQGGDVFVLDMGQPVKIVDLAKRMIHLSGYEVKDEDHLEGDIEVVFSGLRPGEKLYEELLIGDNVTGTDHEKIMRANEELVESRLLQQYLQQLHDFEQVNDCAAAREVLQKVVTGFKPSSDLVDLLIENDQPEHTSEKTARSLH